MTRVLPKRVLRKVRRRVRPVYDRAYGAVVPRLPQPERKYDGEMAYWTARFHAENGVLNNAHYERLMLAMAEENDQSFLRGMVVADFGCGPRGSLAWATEAGLRIGIDVLAASYADQFGAVLVGHDMIYVTSTETSIPIPSALVDVLFTMNAIDHVDHFDYMCDEVVRIIRPGGLFIGSFNLNEPPTLNEPQCLTEEVVERSLTRRLTIEARRVRPEVPGDRYHHFFSDEAPEPRPGEQAILWVRARKR